MSLRTRDPQLDLSAAATADEILSRVPPDEDDLAAEYLLGPLLPIRLDDLDFDFDDDEPEVIPLDERGLALSGIHEEEDL